MNRAIGKNSQVLQILAREIQELISQEEIDMEGLQAAILYMLLKRSCDRDF